MDQATQNCVPSKITFKLEPQSRWSISLRINDTRDLKLKPTQKLLGIDLGLTILLTTSDGEKVANPKNLQKLHKKTELSPEISLIENPTKSLIIITKPDSK